MHEKSVLIELEAVCTYEDADDLDAVIEAAKCYVDNELRGITIEPDLDSDRVASVEYCEVWVNEESTPEQVAVDTAREELAAIVTAKIDGLVKFLTIPGPIKFDQASAHHDALIAIQERANIFVDTIAAKHSKGR